MEIISPNEVPKKPFLKSLFTAPDVTLQELLPKSNEFRINIVNFGKGVRNKLHYHSTEQILIVTEGAGIVATEHHEYLVKVGDIVRIPAKLKHWHGAQKDSTFSHIYITSIDCEITQIEE